MEDNDSDLEIVDLDMSLEMLAIESVNKKTVNIDKLTEITASLKMKSHRDSERLRRDYIL